MIIYLIRRIVYSICLIYTINIFISKRGKIIPINYYTIILTAIFGFIIIFLFIYLKYYYWGGKFEKNNRLL